MAAGTTSVASAGTGSSIPRSMAPGNIAPGSFHESSAASSHGSAASAFNRTVATAPYLGRTASMLSTSAHSSGTGAYRSSGLPATPGTAHQSIESVANMAAHVFTPAGSVSAKAVPVFSGTTVTGAPIRFPLVGRIPDNVHVTPPTQSGGSSSGSNSSGNSGGSSGNNSNNGNQNYGSSPQGTLESGALGNLLYDLLGPAGTGVTPGDAGLQVTPVSPTTTTSSPNVMVGLLALGVLAGIGWYYLRERKKGAGGGGAHHAE